jgi:N-acyl-L-homoserine lactone synthetase
MALVIRPEHRARFAGVLDKVFRLRQRVFVDRLGWKLASNDGVREIDEFDGGPCFHLAVIDPRGEVTATCRLTPSTAPNVTCDVLGPQMGARPFPRAAHIVENSRTCLDLSRPSGLKHDAHLDLRASQQQLCRRMGWTHIVGVGYESMLLQLIRTGMVIEVLAGPWMFPGDREISVGMLGHEDPERPEALVEYLGARVDSLQDPESDPTLFARYGDRVVA